VSVGPLHVRHEQIGELDVVFATGEVDIGSVELLERALEETTAADVVLDVSGLQYVDSAGVRGLERCYRRLRAEQRSLSIVAPPGSTAHWTLHVAGFGDGLVYDDLDAVTAAQPRPA
jgi:anti-anti-sigma factor